MTGCSRNSAVAPRVWAAAPKVAVAAWLAAWTAAALAAPRTLTPGPAAFAPGEVEELMIESRGAYSRDEYEQSLRLAMEVLVDDPSRTEAREIMRLAAQAMAEREIREVQEERKRLLLEAREAHARQEQDRKLVEALAKREDPEVREQLKSVEASRPEWSAWARTYVARSEYLEAYLLIYQILDQFPKEEWAKVQLLRLWSALERDRSWIFFRPRWYQLAVSGHREFSLRNWAAAAADWREALRSAGAGAGLPGETLERRIREAERLAALAAQPKPAFVQAAQPKLALPSAAQPVPTLPPAAEPMLALPVAAQSKLALPRAAQPMPALSLAARLMLALPAAPAVKAAPAAPEPQAAAPRVWAAAAKPAPPPPDPKVIEKLYVHGLVQYGLGQVEAAAATWEEVLRRDPEHAAARRAHERALHELEGGKP